MTKRRWVRWPHIVMIICCAVVLWMKIYWLFAWLIIPYLIAVLIIFAAKRIAPQKFHATVRISIKMLLIIFYSAIFKLYVLDLYRVSGESMEGTLKNGDVLLIATGKRGYATIKRNDIVVYELYPGYFVVKRCIALPGDTLQLKNDSVYINNYLTAFPGYSMSHYRVRFYQQQSISHFLNTIPKNYIIAMYPDSGYILANLPFKEAKKWAVQPGIRLERMRCDQIEGKSPWFLPGKWTVNNMGPVTVPDTGVYYMLGDNREVSEDSRYLGYVPQKNIIGQVMLILYSHAGGAFNWKRFLKPVD